MPHVDLPDWWEWELESSGHLLRRMIDRGFSETDLRTMLAEASSFAPDVEPNRWVISTKWRGRPWEIIVEPDASVQRLVVITAYML